MSDQLNPNGPAPEGVTPQGPEPSGRSGTWTDSVSKDLVEQYGEKLGQFDSYRGFVEGSIDSMAQLEDYKSRFDGRTVVPMADDTGEAWGSLWSSLGKPEEASGYGVEETELSEIFHKSNLTTEQAAALTEGLVGYDQRAREEYDKVRQEEYNATVETMKKKYGEQFEAKILVANEAITNLGGEPVVKLIADKGLDNDPDMIGFFINLGEMMQEGNIPAGQTPKAGQPGFVGTYGSMKGLD
jgi:hypothetical protein